MAPHIYPELEAFLTSWRQHLNPQHGYVFSMKNGAPLTAQALYKVRSTTDAFTGHFSC